MSRFVHWRLIAPLACVSVHAPAAWHDDHPGSGTPAHYVHLVGHETGTDVARRNLLTAQKACVDMKAALGQGAASISADALPAHVTTFEYEIYYAAERSLTVGRTRLQAVDGTTCALKVIDRQTNTIASQDGVCVVDVAARVARGACDGPLAAGVGMPPDSVAASDGGTRQIAGMTCRIRRGADADSEICVADPAGANAPAANPARVRRAPLNGGFAGLLMEVRNRAVTLEADQVRLNLSLSPALFALPPQGVTLRPGSAR